MLATIEGRRKFTELCPIEIDPYGSYFTVLRVNKKLTIHGSPGSRWWRRAQISLLAARHRILRQPSP
jgi:hypothetical protein